MEKITLILEIGIGNNFSSKIIGISQLVYKVLTDYTTKIPQELLEGKNSCKVTLKAEQVDCLANMHKEYNDELNDGLVDDITKQIAKLKNSGENNANI